MKTINTNKLADLIRPFNSTFASIVTETIPKFAKGGRSGKAKFSDATGRDASKYRKVTKSTVLVGSKVDYAVLVENRVVRTTDNFKEDVEHKERKWGTKIDGVEVQHKGESYITTHFVANNKPSVSYTYDGAEIELNDVEKAYLPKTKISSTQADAGLTESTQIVHREYKASSIKAITIGKETYIVV